jgi:hypothetical protein
MTGTAVLTGTPFNIFTFTRVSFQVIWTGTAVGVMTFQVSNFPGEIFTAAGAIKSGVTFTTLTNPSAFTALQPGGTAGSSDFSFADMAQRWIRPIYTNTSSTGVLTIYGAARQ